MVATEWQPFGGGTSICLGPLQVMVLRFVQQMFQMEVNQLCQNYYICDPCVLLIIEFMQTLMLTRCFLLTGWSSLQTAETCNSTRREDKNGGLEGEAETHKEICTGSQSYS